MIILTACWQVKLSLTSGSTTESTPLKFDTANCRYFGGFETMWNLMGNWLRFHAILSTTRTIEPQKIRRRPLKTHIKGVSEAVRAISTTIYRLARIHEQVEEGNWNKAGVRAFSLFGFVTPRYCRKNDHLTVETKLLFRHGSMVSVSLISACFLLSCGFFSAWKDELQPAKTIVCLLRNKPKFPFSC